MTAIATWGGKTAEAKILLESQEIILRGDITAKIPRTILTGSEVKGGRLIIAAGTQKLILDLGEEAAQKWHSILMKPPPSLASKLGISTAKRAFIFGQTSDTELLNAIKDATAKTVSEAHIVIAVLRDASDLPRMLKAAKGLPIWCVYPKGRNACPSDAEVRHFMRANGYMDNKTSAVSVELTATRYTMAK